MSDATLPGVRAALVDPGGTTSRPFYVFFQSQAANLSALSERVDVIESTPSGAGNLSPNANVIGAYSIAVQGTLRTGIARVLLEGDVEFADATNYYGSDGTGVKGWYAISDALDSTANIDLSVGTDGVTTIDLADLADSGAGAALVKITRDAKGRVSGTHAATTSDLAEGANLYFTVPRVLASALAGLSTASSSAITSADTVLSAFGKLQGQATSNATAIAGKEPTIVAGTAAQYWRGDKTWRDFTTDVRAAVLTGLSLATSAVIAATDTVLGALGKLQAQITENLLPAGYIDGLQMQWVSGTALTVTTGAAYIPGLGKVLRATSAIAKTGLALTASTWYHVYFYNNAGTPDIEIVTTAPATAYSGTARSKTGDTSRRYVGSIKTSVSAAIYNFLHTVGTGLVFYRNQQDASPFRLLQNGQATTETSISAAAVIPATAYIMQARLFTSVSTPSAAYFATSDDSASGPPTSGIVGVAPNSSAYTLFPLNSSQQLTYWNQSAPGINQGAFVDVYGYLFER